MSRFYQRYLTLSEDGAIFGYKITNIDEDTKGVSCERLLGYVCRHCLCMFNEGKKNREHILRQHVGPVSCVMCGFDQEDMLELSEHKKMCGFPCDVNGCIDKHKTSVSAKNHYKKYVKSIQ